MMYDICLIWIWVQLLSAGVARGACCSLCSTSDLESAPEHQRFAGQRVWRSTAERETGRPDTLSLSLAHVSPRSWFTIPAMRVLARQVLIDPKLTSRIHTRADESTSSFHTHTCTRAKARTRSSCWSQRCHLSVLSSRWAPDRVSRRKRAFRRCYGNTRCFRISRTWNHLWIWEAADGLDTQCCGALVSARVCGRVCRHVFESMLNI